MSVALPGVRLALWQLVVAFVLLALWRARRLGRPVAEPQPVQLPGAELVVAVGNLLQRAKGRGQAAGLLTDDLRRSLAERLGLPPSAPADQVADAVAAVLKKGVLGRQPPRALVVLGDEARGVVEGFEDGDAPVLVRVRVPVRERGYEVLCKARGVLFLPASGRSDDDAPAGNLRPCR